MLIGLFTFNKKSQERLQLGTDLSQLVLNSLPFKSRFCLPPQLQFHNVKMFARQNKGVKICKNNKLFILGNSAPEHKHTHNQSGKCFIFVSDNQRKCETKIKER